MIRMNMFDSFPKLNFAVLFVVALSLFAVLNAGLVSATHTSSAELQPEWSPAGHNVDYTVTFINNGPDIVDEVRIYRNKNYTNFVCGDKVGWAKYYINTSTKEGCLYISNSDTILPGESEDFNFFATTPQRGCKWVWQFETRDKTFPQTGSIQYLNDTTSVDDIEPMIIKTLGQPKLEKGNETWITQNTPINIRVYDRGECGISGLDYCEYRYDVDGNETLPWTKISWDSIENIEGIINYYYTFKYNEDSYHHLEIRCYDIAGNMAYHEQYERVDSTPPETTKTYGDPHFPEDINNGAAYPHYITTSTPITLDAEDGGDICAVGTKKTYYFDTVVSNSYCYSEEACQPFDNLTGGWQEYTGPFTKKKESCHILQYYSVDELGNVEPMKWQCVFVDDTPPIGIKTIEGPNVPCTQGEDCDYWVQDHATRIGLDCVDQDPHPVRDEKVCYQVNFDGNDVTEQYCNEMSQPPGNIGVMRDGWCCADVSGGLAYWIKFTEDSNHVLSYYCEDGLGNRNTTDTEKFRVDSQPPIISKTIEGPQEGQCPPEPNSEDKCYLKDWTSDSTGSTIVVNAQDDDAYGCAVDQITCQWWYTLDGGQTEFHTENNARAEGKSNWMTVPFEIKFYDDTEHELHIVCKDALGNEAWDNETFYLDSKGPIVEKTIHGPFYKDDNGREWIDTATTIELTATDQPEGTPCAVGFDKIYYRYEIDPTGNSCEYPTTYCHANHSPEDTGWTEYTEPFGIPETSCHVIEYYAVDKLGNIGPVGVNCIYADHTKPIAMATTGQPRINCTIENSPVKPSEGGKCEGTPTEGKELDHPCNVYSYEQCEAVPGCTYMLICEPDDPNLVQQPNDCQQYLTYEDCEAAEGCHVNAEASACIGTPESCEVVAENWPQDPQGICSETPGCTWIQEVKPTCDWWVQDHTTEITLSCRNGNKEPHPSPLDKIYWRVKLDDNPWGEWQSADAESGVKITFNEDSVHTVEYYCTDKVEKESNHGTKVYRVDSTPPEITTGIEGPHYYNETEGRMYINHVTNITVDAVDPDPTGHGCAIDNVTCEWYYYLDDSDIPIQGEANLKPPFKIHFPEETKHELHIVCSDALGNTNEKNETYYVDWTPPTTHKNYGGPQFSEEDADYPKWITSQTPITLTVEDTGPHKSGIKETKYRVTQVDDIYCWNQSLCREQAEGSGDWVTVTSETNPFTIPEESCHLIEYYSTDNVEKQETVKKQCVFVDNTPPEPVKRVGQPNSKIYPENYTWIYYPEVNGRCWTGENPIDCWKVTTLTPIVMDCKDSEPHPVNHDRLCFHVGFDGMDYTEKHCNPSMGGEMTTDDDNKRWCCYEWNEYHRKDQDGVWLYFSEESEHELEFYCEDALGNRGPTDIEKFKVEGTAFEIPIFKKWNLISVPFQLLDSNPEVVFDNISDEVDVVWTYDGETEKWYAYSPDGVDNDDLQAIEPGWGYWVFANDEATLKIGGSLFKPGPFVPVERHLPAGWNLIGYYGTDWQDYNKAVDPCVYGRGLPFYNTVYNSLYSLMDEVTVMDPETGLPVEWAKPNWRSLYAYQTCGIEDPQHQPYWIPLDYEDKMYPGYGYWIYMESDDVYTPSFKMLEDGWWHPIPV